MSRRRVLFLLAGVGILAAVVLIALLRSKPEALYEATLLPALGGIPVAPHALNDHGQVVGVAEVAQGQHHVILWDKDEGLQDLGPWTRPAGIVVFLEINNAGQIAGTVVDANGLRRAFLQDPNGTRRLLAGLAGRETVATALNNCGQVAGYYETGGKPRHACVWDRAGRITDLGTLGGVESLARGINDRGQVVGVSDVRGPVWQVFLWDPNTGMVGLGPAPLRMATSCRINNQGLVAGQFGSASHQEAFSIWTRERGLQRVHSLESASVALAGLNDANQILVNTFRRGIRISNLRFFSKASSYLCDPNGAGTAVENLLADRKSSFHNATDINNHGCLVGFLATPSIGWNGVILEPIRERARE